ncbi:helicase protein MOM1 isoform X1 [Jatropha curcas]|uniref:helicase protein MOM1 isoform X1 n=1 Tax=Jatropha curcas TaxID=180498 RepID=UPI0018939EF8|nr:helicase protein MOM1 isoform X1 [Jatropha curcas]
MKKVSSLKSLKLSADSVARLGNNHLDFVNNLRERWYKGKNVLIDDQERIVKVISFISSLSSDVYRPFLIITTSAAIPLWDEELFHLAPYVNTVAYCGDKDMRRSIKAFEFYGLEGGIMFDVLITSPEVVAEDLNELALEKWEAVIVDECQRSKMYSHFEQIKSLSTDMRLLLVNGQLKDGVIEHLLSLLDRQSDRNSCEDLVTNSNHKIGNSKERLSKFIVTGSKPESSRYVEYWVPVQIPNIQLEQYCATLLMNSLSLFSPSKNDLVGALRDILISTRKCCDHPYIMDPQLQPELTKGRNAADFLDIGIKASGKLQILDAMLSEIRNKGLKVLILFKSCGSGKYHIGDILDDFVRQRFGKDSYERLDQYVLPTRKQAALNNFNNQKGSFVFLLETCACLPSIKLSSVDTVIIFNSDWTPTNDLRNLQKITLDTQSEQLKIFRLYSSCTVEENVLIFAKQGKIIDSDLQSISRPTSHSLLMWGVSYLFSKLDEFHSGGMSVTSLSPSLEQLPLKDIIQQFLNVLSQNAKCNDTGSNSLILKVKQNSGIYCTDCPLPSELKIQSSEELPHEFWRKLLEGKHPKWKYPSSLSQRNRKRVQRCDDILKKPEDKVDEIVKGQKKVANNEVNLISLRPALSAGNIVAGGSKVSLVPSGSFRPSSHFMHRSTSGPIGRLNIGHGDQALTAKILVNNLSEVRGADEGMNFPDLQKSLHLGLRPRIAKLCEILRLPEDVKAMAQSLLEYVMNNHRVSRESENILQAFQIALCWTAASLLKHKLGHKESLAHAKQHLNFSCKKEEADYVYSLLRCLKKMFLYHTGNCTLSSSPKASQSLNKDHLHARSSQPTLFVLQKVRVGFEEHGQEFFDEKVLSQLGLAQQDVLKSIKDIEKKCHKQMTQLSQKQKEQKEEIERKFKEEKAQLENKQKTEAAVIRLHSNSSMRTDKLKLLDIEYAKKFEELELQKEIRLQDLEATHLLAMKKLKERKACWLDGVKSWAESELMNKLPSNEIENNQENVVSLNSHMKEQNPKGVGSVQDREALLEVLETLSSNDKVDMLPGVPPTNEQTTDGEDPLRVSMGISSRDGLTNVETVNINSSEEQIPNTGVLLGVSEVVNSNDGLENTVHELSSNEQSPNGATLLVPKKIPMGLPEKVSSPGYLEKMGAPEALDDGNTIVHKEDGVHAISCGDASEVDQQDEVVCIFNQDPCSTSTAGDQQSGKVSSGVPKNASNTVVDDRTGKQPDGKVLVDKIISKENSDCSDRTAGLSQQDGESQSVLPESTPGEVVDDGETGKKQDGEVQADDAVNDQGPQSSDRTAGVAEGFCTNKDNDGVCVMASSFIARIDQQDGVIASRGSENNPSELVVGGCHGGEINEACGEAASNNANQQDTVISVINEDDHLQEPCPAVQDESPLPTASARSQDRVATATGNHNTLQQVEASVASPDDAVASTQTDNDIPVVEHVLQTQSSASLDSAFCLEAMDLPLDSGIESQLTYDGLINNNAIEASTQILENQMEHSNQATLQPATHVTQHPPISSVVNNRLARTEPPVLMPPLPSYPDPLQNELDRIRKETDQIISVYEDDKLRLKSDCEKEIEEVVAQIRRKYEIKLQEVESEFILKKKELDTNQNKVLMNKILAEAFRSKCMDMKASGRPGVHREVASSFMQQLLQISSQPTAQRNATVSGLPASGPQLTAPGSHGKAPSVQVVHHSSTLFSGTQTRPPLISSISPTTGNLQIGSEIRAPAPHLQPFRSSASTTSTNVPSPSIVMPSVQVPSNPLTTSTTPTQLPLRPQQSHYRNISNRPETARISSPLSNPSPSALELLRDVENQTNRNSNSHPLTRLGSNTDPLVMPEIGQLNDKRTDVACPSEVVCLSDDD